MASPKALPKLPGRGQNNPQGQGTGEGPLLSSKYVQTRAFPPTREDKKHGSCSRHFGSAEKQSG